MRNVFEDQLNTELLKSEKKRTVMIIAIFSFALVYRVVDYLLFVTDEELKRIASSFTVWLFPVIVILFEFLSMLYINWRLRTNRKKIPLTAQFLNTALEICLPSLIILSVARQFPAYDILKSPALYIYFIFIILSTLRLNFALSFFCGLLSGAAFVLFRLLIAGHFSSNDGGRAIILLLSGIAAGMVALQIKKGITTSIHEAEKRLRVENLFGQQISAEVAGKMLETDGFAESRKMPVTVMFIDIRNFTRFAAERSPEEVVAYQNKFLNIIITCVSEQGGIVNQILGDGCMITFGAPVPHADSPQRAVNAAVGILECLEASRQKGAIHPTKVGIGIHSGEAITGNIGTEFRKQYSITGSVVIIASRIEQLNKEFSSQLLISEDVFNSIDMSTTPKSLFKNVELKGFEQTVNIYKIA